MKSIFQHEKYGTIEYIEGFWLGTKKLFIDGQQLCKLRKGTYQFINQEGKTELCFLGGNFIKGARLSIGKEEIALTPPIRWYEYLLAIAFFGILMVWGNVPSLVAIIPIVGGAIGGGVYAVIGCIALYLMKRTGNVWLKLLVWALALAFAFLVGFLLALLVIDILLRAEE